MVNPLMEVRLSLLLDTGSFCRQGPDHDSELVGGTGTIGGRRVCVIAINPRATISEDAFAILNQEHALLDLAEREKIPLIHLADRPGRVAMDTTAIPLHIMRTFIDRDGSGRVFARFAHLSGIVPRVAVVFSPIATTLTYPVAECDTVVMVHRAGMSLARPDMVRLMTGDPSPYEEYGGAEMHSEISGICDKLVFSEEEALAWVRSYISLFPLNYQEMPPVTAPLPPGRDFPPDPGLVPADLDMPFDMFGVIGSFIDGNSFLEHRHRYAREVITAVARVEGMPVAIIANNPEQRGGILFPETCRKIAAFASLSDAFNLPLVFLADTPGFMVGRQAEQAGIIHAGALLFSTIANISVPHTCVVVRKAYTAGLYAMGGPGFEPDRFLAFPQAHITIYGPKAIQLLAKESHMGEEARSNVADQVRESCNVWHYQESGDLDAVVSPEDLRGEIVQFLKKVYNRPLERKDPRRVLCV